MSDTTEKLARRDISHVPKDFSLVDGIFLLPKS